MQLGAVTDTYEYDAFGNLLNPTSNGTPNNYLYRGEQFDSDLGLYYLRARYMNSLTGRFMGRDPEDGDVTTPATLHKYLYAGGDPVNGADPRGTDIVEYIAVVIHSGYETYEYGSILGPCVANALTREAMLTNAVTEGAITQDSGGQIGQYLYECGGEASKELLGPILKRVF
ncbi:MAG: RHS repeat-associated core domain-containing protein [Terracidiphilus sp.]